MKKITSVGSFNVYRKAETGEWIVRRIGGGPDEGYFTNDKQDAIDTAKDLAAKEGKSSPVLRKEGTILSFLREKSEEEMTPDERGDAIEKRPSDHSGTKEEKEAGWRYKRDWNHKFTKKTWVLQQYTPKNGWDYIDEYDTEEEAKKQVERRTNDEGEEKEPSDPYSSRGVSRNDFLSGKDRLGSRIFDYQPTARRI